MKIKTACVLLIGSLFMAACSPHRALEYFDKNEHFERAMTNLQIGTLVEGLETKAVLKAIYLNQVYKDEYQEGENFYISTYIDKDPYEETLRGLNHKLYTLTLNDQKPTKVKELKDDDVLRLDMPLTERWSRYYYVRFDAVEGNDLNLTFAHKHQGTIVLKYEKDELEK